MSKLTRVVHCNPGGSLVGEHEQQTAHLLASLEENKGIGSGVHTHAEQSKSLKITL